MCGNGLRCFIRYLIDRAIIREKYTIETVAGTHTAWAEGPNIAIQLPPPHDIRWNLAIENYMVHHLNTGVPHAVLFVDSVHDVDLNQVGPLIRHHPLFPHGTNLNLVQLHPLRMRTYERGVEQETLACGTGAVASALAAAHLFALPSPLSIGVQSGDHLKISFSPDWKAVVQEGPAICTGTFAFN
ncbi:MAG: Diaminopimelate epimerase [Chlamydiales bacterium]|nr:Diaminopimelate epimerase [Chlamydiales bacterium]